MKRVLVLGSTGSIGTNTLNIIKYMPEDFVLCGGVNDLLEHPRAQDSLGVVLEDS